MIYVIGIDHQKAQFPHGLNEDAEVAALKTAIQELHKKHSLVLVAEEWCDDARKYQSVTTTYSEDMARELGIPHLSCDPSLSERSKMGIRSRQDIASDLGFNFSLIIPGSYEEKKVNEHAQEFDKKREEYWFDQVVGSGHGFTEIALVCGFEHADSFVALAKAKGYRAEKVTVTT